MAEASSSPLRLLVWLCATHPATKATYAEPVPSLTRRFVGTLHVLRAVVGALLAPRWGPPELSRAQS